MAAAWQTALGTGSAAISAPTAASVSTIVAAAGLRAPASSVAAQTRRTGGSGTTSTRAMSGLGSISARSGISVTPIPAETSACMTV